MYTYIHILDNIYNTPKMPVIFCETAYNSIKKIKDIDFKYCHELAI